MAVGFVIQAPEVVIRWRGRMATYGFGDIRLDRRGEAVSQQIVATGSLVGLPVLREWAWEAWAERGAELRTALAAVHGPEASTAKWPPAAFSARPR